MGCGSSIPVEDDGSTREYVCMALNARDKLSIVNGTPEVINAVYGAAREVSDDKVQQKMKYGTVQFKFPGWPFSLGCGQDSATLGKVLSTRVLEKMHAIGYDFLVSSDLTRVGDNSSWFFRKVAVERSNVRVLCVAPGSTDKIVVVRGDPGAVATIKYAIENHWPRGIQKEKVFENMGETLTEFKLHGNPWFSSGQDAADCRRLLLGLIGKLAQHRWRLMAGTSIKGGTDTMFFVRDDSITTHEGNLAMISLNRTDRIRLINFDEGMIPISRQSIQRSWPRNIQDEQIYHGTYEFKVHGTPFHSSGDESVQSRLLVCSLIQDFKTVGWDCITTLDVSRKLSDKSVFIFHRSAPAKIRVGCVALTDVDHLRIINFPPELTQKLREDVYMSYGLGINKEDNRGSVMKMYLNGVPWQTSGGSDGFHARKMLMKVIKTAMDNGWWLISSADVSAKYVQQENGPDYPLDVHSLFFAAYVS